MSSEELARLLGADIWEPDIESNVPAVHTRLNCGIGCGAIWSYHLYASGSGYIVKLRGFYEGEGSGNTPIDALHALCENVGQRYPISRHSSPTPRLESQILLSSAVINKRGGEA